jgi:hypothetical protein
MSTTADYGNRRGRRERNRPAVRSPDGRRRRRSASPLTAEKDEFDKATDRSRKRTETFHKLARLPRSHRQGWAPGKPEDLLRDPACRLLLKRRHRRCRVTHGVESRADETRLSDLYRSQ